MNRPIITEIYETTDCTAGLPYNDLSTLINKLNDLDGFIRMQTREILCCFGTPAIPQLIKTLSNANSKLRLEVIKVLECIQDLTAIPILVEQLKDDNAGIRWAASNALVGMEREVLPAIFSALVRDFDCIGLRQSAHHILHVFKDDGKLNEPEVKVYEALQDVQPGVAVPWAAEKALESLRYQKK